MTQDSWAAATVNAAADLFLLPLVLCAVLWARSRETTILSKGVPLAAGQLRLARAVGVVMPERVRVQSVETVPMPLPRSLRRVAELLGWLSPHIVGMTLGYGIVLRRDVCGDPCLLAHELAHVAQYERLGRFRGFLRQYVRECVWPGYPKGALEIEARRAEALVVGKPTQQPTQVRENVIPYCAINADKPHLRC